MILYVNAEEPEVPFFFNEIFTCDLSSSASHCYCTKGAVGNEVELSVDSTGYPSVYKDELITLTCTASGETDVTAIYLVKGARVEDDRSGCAIDSIDKTWLPYNALNIPGFSRIDEAYCIAAAAGAPPFIFSVTRTVSDDLLGYNFKCFADFTSIRVNSTSFSISTINEVLKGNIVVESTNKYTPTEDDREGLTLRCKDITHLALANVYPDIIIKSEKKIPQYIDYEVIPTVLHQDPKSPLTLSCNVIGNPTPSYTWTCSKGCTDTATYQLVIPANSRENGQLERVRCTASIEFLEPITNIYNILWTKAAGLPSTTQALLVTERKASSAVLSGSVAGVLAVSLVALISQSAVFCWWKKRADEQWKSLESRRIGKAFIADTEINLGALPASDTRDDNYEALIPESHRDHPYDSLMHVTPYENIKRN
ncbi:uncharacterized protein [Watersipora subatra]|uniref:uncharacterized protein n=1 Tax=Watersipora subatra TaxID=2589382 RepID=UPI00355AF635